MTVIREAVTINTFYPANDLFFDVPYFVHDIPVVQYALNNDFLATCDALLSRIYHPRERPDSCLSFLLDNPQVYLDRACTYAFKGQFLTLDHHPLTREFSALFTDSPAFSQADTSKKTSFSDGLVVDFELADVIALFPVVFDGIELEDKRDPLLRYHPHIEIVKAIFRYYATMDPTALREIVFTLSEDVTDLHAVDGDVQHMLKGTSFDDVHIALHPFLTTQPINRVEYLLQCLDVLQTLLPHRKIEVSYLTAAVDGKVNAQPFLNASWFVTNLEQHPSHSTLIKMESLYAPV